MHERIFSSTTFPDPVGPAPGCDVLTELLRDGAQSAAADWPRRSTPRSTARRRRTHILLKTDAHGPDAWPDERIAEALDTTRMTVRRVRQQFATQGLNVTLHRKRSTERQYRKHDAKHDGKHEAQLVAIACSPAPEGRTRWSMKRLADRLVELEVVESIDPTRVCRTLKTTRSSRGSSSSG